ncbi:hypothetical protein MMC08_003441 [Hypocenomyce scalaris]|nr:hypothetical protein [Hypocenomyce scalaris]
MSVDLRHGENQTSKQRRTGRLRSRGVSNLTPEQLQKKRASDREAQRVVRNRTRSQIEAFEKRIQELKSQQPYQELQLALQQKERIEAENRQLQQQLSRIIAIVQPSVAETAVSTADDDSNPATLRSSNSPQPFQQATSNFATGDRRPQEHDLRPNQLLAFNASDEVLSDGAGSAADRARSPTLAHPRNSYQPHTAVDGVLSATHDNMEQERSLPQDRDHVASPGSSLLSGQSVDPNAQQLFHRRSGSGSASSPAYSQVGSAGYSALQASPRPLDVLPMGPPILHSPLNHKPLIPSFPPTCILDNVLVEFLAERREQLTKGMPLSTVLGPPHPTMAPFVYPERSVYSHPLSKVFTDLIRAFPNLHGLPERVAICYIMFWGMRWQIYPSQDEYIRMPEWCAPRPVQLLIPHPVWIDYLAWPLLRERLVGNYRHFPFVDFFIPFGAGMSLNWPYDPMDCLLKSPDAEGVTINPVFEQHLRNLDNWSLGSDFAKEFPSLADTVKIKSDSDVPPLLSL